MNIYRFVGEPNLGSPRFISRAVGACALLATVATIAGPPAYRAFQGEDAKILDSGSGVTQAHADERYLHDVVAPGIRRQLAQQGIVLPPPEHPDDGE